MDKQFKNQGVLRLQPHDHACLIYESESEWRDNVIPFIIVGLQQGEKCVYGLNHRSQQYIENCLREEGINVGAYKESGQLLILDKSVLPGECAIDRLDQIQAFYIQFLEQALSEGYPAVRCTNESLYTLLGMGSAHNMVEVNSRMNTIIFPHYPCIALCQYDRFKTDPKILKYAILSHPIVIRNSELYVNLSSIRDERFLKITSDRWEAEHWLAVIERENREIEKLQMISHTLNNSSQPLLSFHADGSIIACNEAFYQLMGRSGEPIQHLEEVEPYWQEYLALVIEELKQRGAHRYEREWPQPDGSRVVLDMSVLEGFDDSGNVAYYYASIIEVTGQKEAEEALRKSEEHYRLIAENAYDMITIIDRETLHQKYLSPSHERIVGYTAADLLGKSCLLHIHPDDIEAVIEKLYECIKKGSAGTQYRSHNKDGVYLWLDSFGKVIESGEYKGDILIITRDITERKKAEIELRNSEEKYRLITENAHDMIGIIDPVTLVFKYASHSYSRTSGHPMEEFVASDSFKFIHPDDIEGLKQRLHQLLKDGNHHAQYRAQHRNGTYLWLDTIGKKIEEGEFKEDVLLITRDITERKMAEIALRNSEEKYRLIVDNAYDGISIFDSSTLISFYQNPALKEMLGYSENATLNSPLFEFVHPDELTMAEEKVKEGMEKGEGSIQCRLRKNDGSYIWMEINGKVMHKDSDNPLLLFICRDISQRKQVEEELRASEARLRYSEQDLKQRLDYLNYLINTMNEVFVTYDLNHRITFVNNAVYKQLGYQPKEMLGHNVLDYISPPDKERMEMYIGNRVVDGKPGIFETIVKRKNGSEALVRIKSSPIKENDTIIGAMLLLEDISEYRKIQREMARLDQLNTVGEIAAGIGHEIRNPMTTVKGFLQILSQDEDFIHHQQYFNLMLDELERANAIISEFLALAKNKLVDLQPRNLNSIITAIFPLLQADAMLADKSIVLDLAEIPDLLLDEKEIRQLILNLVRNGLEAMQAGRTVYINTYLEEEQVVLSVRDEGKGIDKDLLEKLGTPFFTTKDNGTGLGLAICYSIVARHEASIHPDTNPTGSTFIIRFKIPRLSTGQMTLPLTVNANP